MVFAKNDANLPCIPCTYGNSRTVAVQIKTVVFMTNDSQCNDFGFSIMEYLKRVILSILGCPWIDSLKIIKKSTDFRI